MTNDEEKSLTAIILDSLPVAVFGKAVQDNYRFTVWNKFAEKVFGLRKEDVLGKTDYDLFPRAQADFFRTKDESTVRTRKPVTIEEEPVGDKLWVRTQKVPVFDGDGKPYLLLGICEDITARREAHATIRNQEIQIHTNAKFSALGEMAGGIAHEINNPLTVIIGKAQLLLEKQAQNRLTPEKLLETLERIVLTSHRITKVVRGLKAISRDAEQDPPESASLGAAIEDALDLCREKFKAHGVELRTQDCGETIEVFARPAQIAQILVNLLNNAFDAVGALETEKWVAIKTEKTEDKIRLIVQDSGRGIPPPVAARMMDPFFTTKEVGKGTGLGLSISSRIALANGGRLFYDSLQPHTTFILELPLTGAQEKAA